MRTIRIRTTSLRRPPAPLRDQTPPIRRQVRARNERRPSALSTPPAEQFLQNANRRQVPRPAEFDPAITRAQQISQSEERPELRNVIVRPLRRAGAVLPRQAERNFLPPELRLNPGQQESLTRSAIQQPLTQLPHNPRNIVARQQGRRFEIQQATQEAQEQPRNIVPLQTRSRVQRLQRPIQQRPRLFVQQPPQTQQAQRPFFQAQQQQRPIEITQNIARFPAQQVQGSNVAPRQGIASESIGPQNTFFLPELQLGVTQQRQQPVQIQATASQNPQRQPRVVQQKPLTFDLIGTPQQDYEALGSNVPQFDGEKDFVLRI